MKKFFKSLKDLILRHKLLTIICFLALIAIVAMGYVFFAMFVSNAGKYGNRLDGIEEVTVTATEKKDIVSFLEEKEPVTESSVRVQGKIIYINIKFAKDTPLDKAKAIATETLALIKDEQKSFYDIGYFLQEETEEDTEDKGFVITGSKNSNLESISWIKG